MAYYSYLNLVRQKPNGVRLIWKEYVKGLFDFEFEFEFGTGVWIVFLTVVKLG